MLGVPLHLDQQQNMVKVAQYGIGEYLNYNNITTELVVETIRTIIESPRYDKKYSLRRNLFCTSIQRTQNYRYARQIAIRSKLFQNQPIHPLDRAVFWIENTMTSRGTKHLSLTNFELNFFQFYMLDVIGFVLFICLAFLFLIRRHIHFGKRDNKKECENSTVAAVDNMNKTEKIE